MPNGVLRACIKQSVPYVDMCNNYPTSCAAQRQWGDLAMARNVSCIVLTGCWLGILSLMAKQLCRHVLQQYKELRPEDLKVDFGFFTSGLGGAGVTLLVATFLILAEKALVIENGRRQSVPPMRDYVNANFGPIIGDRSIAPLNLLEAASMHNTLGVGSTRCQFGTAPGFWNALLEVMALLPPSLLSNKVIMRQLSVFSLPIVCLVNLYAGATNAMRCDVTVHRDNNNNNSLSSVRATAIYGHDNLEPCVGECVAAFACAVLARAVPPGVWLPKQAMAGGNDAARVLGLAGVGCHTLLIEAEHVALEQWDMWGSVSTSNNVPQKTLL